MTTDAWADVFAALDAYGRGEELYLRSARAGHPKARAIIASALDSVSGCAYDFNGPCANVGRSCAGESTFVACECETRERKRLRDALAALAAMHDISVGNGAA